MSEPNFIEKAETAIKHVAAEVMAEAKAIENAIVTEAKEIATEVKSEAVAIATEVKADYEKAVTVVENAVGIVHAIENIAKIPNAAEYAGAPKNNPAPQTLAPSGRSRYAADGLTIDWFATHPRK